MRSGKVGARSCKIKAGFVALVKAARTTNTTWWSEASWCLPAFTHQSTQVEPAASMVKTQGACLGEAARHP
eukprot:10293617-Lingulodinium_polyedra.AAC.1